MGARRKVRQAGQDNKRTKATERRRQHIDKYANRVGNDKLARLAERFNSEEADRG